ncbi:pimeloyl-ACP methyl ester carboxylesterase [Nakamurella sp. UYEF19]|uniref:alpha/beta fold hydrolase n=1 Tax=Nakamurella sp. UYEF19 TaxID=1756392 RepID=UPI003390F8EA
MTAAPPDSIALEVTGADGAAISVRIRPAGGPPVLLVHGFGSSGNANWSATGWLRGLERAGITSVTVDLRGHGLSTKPHDPAAYSLPIVLTDLHLVLAALPARLGPTPQIDLVGYSMGSRLVGELVAAATGSVTGLERPAWSAGLPHIRRVVIGGYDGRAPLGSLDDEQFAEFTAALAGADGPDSPARRLATIARSGRNNDLAALAAMVRGLGSDRSVLDPGVMRVPTLAVAGDQDFITDDTLGWADGLPDGRHLWLPGRGHINAVTSSVFRAAAIAFLTDGTD